MLRIYIAVITILITSTVQAANLKDKKVAVASFVSDEFMIIVHETPSIFEIHKTVIPRLDFNKHFVNKLVAHLQQKLSAVAMPVIDTTTLPKQMKFGSFGPSDEVALNAIYNANIDSDYLLVFYPGESVLIANIKGGGFSTTNASLDHVTLVLEMMLFDLNTKTLSNYNTVIESENYSFTREPLDHELSEIEKETLNGVDDQKIRKKLTELIHSTPFSEEKVLKAYEDLVTDNEEELEYVSYSIQEVIHSVTPELSKFKPEEQKKVRDYVYQAMDDAIPGILEDIDEQLSTDDF